MVKTLELAISNIKGRELSEAAQEQLGRELLERIDALAELRTEIEVGLRELDAGLGEELDIEAFDPGSPRRICPKNIGESFGPPRPSEICGAYGATTHV